MLLLKINFISHNQLADWLIDIIIHRQGVSKRLEPWYSIPAPFEILHLNWEGRVLQVEMPKIIQPGEDEWFGVQDAKKRKQIQDRLAQRARRESSTPSPYS